MADLSSILGSAGIGGTIGKAIVSLELDTAKYQAELRAAQAQTTAGANGMSQGFAAFGGVAKAGMAAAGIAVVAFGANAVRAASDLGEAVNKSNVIFGDNAAEIEAWAETGAAAFGLSKTAALDAAAGFGAMLDTAGLAGDAAANMSKDIVQLAGDMASFNNIDPTEALEKLRSGLAGEAEPLRRFGVFLSEAAVQQEAYQSGIAAVGAELTEAQKIQARYNIIFEQTTKQQGDFARTADALPNQIRSLKAEFENVSAEVGESLLPVMTKLLEAVRALVPLLSLVADGLVVLTEHFGILAGPVGLVTDLLGESGFKGEMAALEKQTRPTAEAIVKFGEAVGEDALPKVQKFIPFLFRTGESLDEVGKEADKTGKDIVEFADISVLALEDLSSQSGVTSRDFIQAHRVMEREARELARALREIAKERWINAEYIAFLSEQGPEWLIAFADLTAKQQRKAQDAWDESTKKTDAAKRSLDDIGGALEKLDKGESKHRVVIEYEYRGFDPSKPGMSVSRPVP